VFAELNRSEQVLQRLALASPPNELAKGCELGLGQRTLKLEIKLDSFFA
jgi:hypothetical protein